MTGLSKEEKDKIQKYYDHMVEELKKWIKEARSHIRKPDYGIFVDWEFNMGISEDGTRLGIWIYSVEGHEFYVELDETEWKKENVDIWRIEKMDELWRRMDDVAYPPEVYKENFGMDKCR